MSGSGPHAEDSNPRHSFETTHWSVVLAAGQDSDHDRADSALETLCRSYWFPLFAYVRRSGYQTADAQDLVQGFFARILERKDLQAVRRERGRFRSYMLAALKNFMASEWRRSGAEKRGGGRIPIPLDELLDARADAGIPVDERSPDRVFDQQWAIALVNRVHAGLREEYCADGREKLFERLQGYLADSHLERSQAEIASDLTMTEGAVKQAAFRLRRRHQDLLRTEVAQTVATLGDVDEELRHLIKALRG